MALFRDLAQTVRPLSGSKADFDEVIELVGDASCVLIGEATHGTHELHHLRAQLTKRLIVQKGFAAVAAEADWPDAYRVNRYVRGLGRDTEAMEALTDFRRFPAWMWCNTDLLAFVGWLRDHNDRLDARRKVGFYGLDLYCLRASMASVLEYLDRVDPEAARRARYRWACFDQFGEELHAYGYTASIGLGPDCEREVIAQLVDSRDRRADQVRREGLASEDQPFEAEQNVLAGKQAQAYYRTMFQGRVSWWNLRDTHMAHALDALLAHLGSLAARPKLVVWAHNSHVGDARATEMGETGELNLGQLARQSHPNDAILIGSSTCSGTVTAASEWDGPAECMRVRPALSGSYEQLFHQTGVPRFFLPLRDLGEAAGALSQPRLQRAIGVVYLPQTERLSHYFEARLPSQFDAILHVDETGALEPLERTAGWEHGEAPDTFASGI